MSRKEELINLRELLLAKGFNAEESRKIDELVTASHEVIRDAAFPNGAIVAANSSHPIYPAGAQDYLGVWPRDSAYIAMAADCLGMEGIPEKFFEWCVYRAEGFAETGLFGTQYHLNGTIGGTALNREELRLDRDFESRFLYVSGRCSEWQPDQSASVILAANFHLDKCGRKLHELPAAVEMVRIAADGLVANWSSSVGPAGGFTRYYWDCWEERFVEPGRHHLYSLALSVRGLDLAIEMFEKADLHLDERIERWRTISKDMRMVFDRAYRESPDVLPRTWPVGNETHRFVHVAEGEINSKTDSSLFGLIWPAGILNPDDPKIIATVARIYEENGSGGGLKRFPGDPYCGGMRECNPTFTGAGPWIILSCFASICHTLNKEEDRARAHIRWILNNAGRYWPYLPEQVHKEEKPSIVPLAWSHAMFILALDALGIPLKKST